MIFINSTKLILESDRFKVETVEYSLDGPERYKRDFVRHPGAVVILPLTSTGDLIFVKQPRVALAKELLELPAGTKMDGEAPLDCAKRELAEEVGLAATKWLSLGEIFPAPGFCDEKLFLFVASDLSEFKLQEDADERITIHTYSKREVMEMIANRTLEDAKSLALLFRAQIEGLW